MGDSSRLSRIFTKLKSTADPPQRQSSRTKAASEGSPASLAPQVVPDQDQFVSQGTGFAVGTRAGQNYGIAVLHDAENNSSVDIVFVHGLTGNASTTWLHKDSGIHWPRDLLCKDVSDARIMTFGYDADVVNLWNPASTSRLSNHAETLMGDLARTRDRTDTEARPIIFVAHSLGGLIVERALTHSRNTVEEDLRQIEHCIVAVLFLGVPHCGSYLAEWASVGTRMVSLLKQTNRDIVKVLDPGSEMLRLVEQGFHNLLRLRKHEQHELNVTCFFEELPVIGIGLIVPLHSSEIKGYRSYGIHANHMDMTKFPNSQDRGYDAILGELQRWKKRLSGKARLKPDASSPVSYFTRLKIISGALASSDTSDKPSVAVRGHDSLGNDSRNVLNNPEVVVKHSVRKQRGETVTRNYLGPWYPLLMNNNKIVRAPVLRKSAFASYIVREDGELTPKGPCIVTAQWTVFLHALGITPKTYFDIPTNLLVSWRPLEPPMELKTGDLFLELPGQAFCHVINLYAFANDVFDPFAKSSTHAFKTQLGTLQWYPFEHPGTVDFTQNDVVSLNEPRLPFETLGQFMNTGAGVMKYYHDALDSIHGTSDPSLVWPEPKDRLKTRLQALKTNLQRLHMWQLFGDLEQFKAEQLFTEAEAHYTSLPQPERENLRKPKKPVLVTGMHPLLLTSRWFDAANRIFNRCTTDGGDDQSFHLDILAAVDHLPPSRFVLDGVFSMKKRVASHSSSYFERLAMYPEKMNLMKKRGLSRSRNDQEARKIFMECSKIVLESYENANPDSRKRELYEAKDEVCWLLSYQTAIDIDTRMVRILPFSADSSLWDQTLKLY